MVSAAEHAQCFICKQATVFGNLCVNCAQLGSLDNVFVMAPYEQEQIQELIHLYKYDFVEEAGGLLAALASAYLERIHFYELARLRDPLVVPVPLSARRMRERGYNQSQILATAVAAYCKAAQREDVIIRPVHTKRQATLSRAGRISNMRGTFAVSDSHQVLGRDVIICDDVVTTGATLEACAAALKDAGAARVIGVALAHHLG